MKKGYFFVFLTAIISGFSIFINRFGVEVLNPYLFTWLKNSSVALLLTSLLFSLRDWRIVKKLTKKQWLLLSVIGLVGGSIPFLLFFKGLSLTNVVMGSFLHKTMFIYVAVLSFIFLKEKIDKSFLLGGVFLSLGNLLLFNGLSFSINRGDLLILLAALFWAIENTISKYALRELPSRIVAWGRMFFGSLFICLFLLFTGQVTLLFNINFTQISWVIITSVILFAYVITWYKGLKYIPVSRATVILLLGSPITTLLSFIWTRQINLEGIFASFLIVLGVIFVLGLKETWKLINELKKTIYARV